MKWLRALRVIDLSSEIAGPYCTKLLADAGADVVKVESAAGDPLRRWTASGAPLGEGDGALFRFLNAGKRSIVGTLEDPDVAALVADADLVVESLPIGAIDRLALHERHPALVVMSITPFGRGGPWTNRPATEFTVQAESGSIGVRGLAEQVPFQAGGRIAEWTTGSFAAVAALAAVWRSVRTGHGEHVDVSMLEAMTLSATVFLDLFWSLFGRPDPPPGPARTIETPSIEPTADGWVGFCTNTGQQFRDFLVLIERTDLLDDAELALAGGRQLRYAEWTRIVREWTTRHATEEIVERAQALRIPVAPVCDGATVQHHPHLVARGAFGRDPDDTFTCPRPPYRIDGVRPEPGGRAPRLGEHCGAVAPRGGPRPKPHGARVLPLAGLRVVDLTNWWAGPSGTHVLAALGADVVHVESAQKPDGARFAGGVFLGMERGWEYSPFFLAANTNKRDLTLDLSTPAGLDAMRGLLARADAFVENYSPRVVEGFGLDWPAVHALNPRLVMVRMPAFGLTGPWRDAVGFAQTMEQLTGLAWLTGHVDDQPRIQRGPCDPIAGMHAVFALLVALFRREMTGRGSFVELSMVEAALNVAAEQVIEASAYGARLARTGNRSPGAAPQGLYPCRGVERWLALSVASDAQWNALCAVVGHPAWAADPTLATHVGRAAAHDRIDDVLAAWCAPRELEPTVAALVAAGVPAAALVDPRMTSRHPQMAARGFFEECAHPVVGTHPIPTLPFRFASVARWTRTPAPLLGEHNAEVLRELGFDDVAITRLAADGIIGDLPKGT